MHHMLRFGSSLRSPMRQASSRHSTQYARTWLLAVLKIASGQLALAHPKYQAQNWATQNPRYQRRRFGLSDGGAMARQAVLRMYPYRALHLHVLKLLSLPVSASVSHGRWSSCCDYRVASPTLPRKHTHTRYRYLDTVCMAVAQDSEVSCDGMRCKHVGDVCHL